MMECWTRRSKLLPSVFLNCNFNRHQVSNQVLLMIFSTTRRNRTRFNSTIKVLYLQTTRVWLLHTMKSTLYHTSTHIPPDLDWQGQGRPPSCLHFHPPTQGSVTAAPSNQTITHLVVKSGDRGLKRTTAGVLCTIRI